MNESQIPVDTGVGKILNAGRNLWLAGLGVAAEVEENGRGLFGRLVELGRPVEEKQKKAATDMAEKTTATVKGFGKLVEDTVAYESREMLKRFNVMTKDDVRIFAARLDTLGKKLDEYAAARDTMYRVALKEEETKLIIPATEARKPKATRKRQTKTTKKTAK
ncbi:MAG TPA: phasin family protein [Thermoanaerobaculia bacterium]|nr:phasin family protein [Thermoanaerobaculia bacterium]